MLDVKFQTSVRQEVYNPILQSSVGKLQSYTPMILKQWRQRGVDPTDASEAGAATHSR